MSIVVRRAQDRGHFDHGWLKTWHSFSFGDYRDPRHMGFSELRVINQDIVEPGQGFAPHGHRDMEIITYVIRGAIKHQDSMGNEEIVPAGDVQRMTAGSGVQHSEVNPSQDEELELLQIWIHPDQKGLEPGYEQRSFAERGEGLQLLVAPDGRGDALKIHQDAEIWAARLKPGEEVTHELKDGRRAWVQVVSGKLSFAEGELGPGDGASVEGFDRLDLKAEDETEFLLFDLP